MQYTQKISFRILMVICIGLLVWGGVFFTSLNLGLRNAIIKNEIMALDAKVNKVKILLDLEKKDLLDYIEYLQGHEKFDIKDKSEMNEMLEHCNSKLKLTNAAIFNSDSKVLYAINNATFNAVSEKDAVSGAIKGERTAKITVKDSSVLVSVAGRLPLKEGIAVILLQKVISSCEILSRYSTFL
ncbi:MAG: hypothetical protein II220_07285 [Spirochaetales bacterium]|nr:hypothetical protein [Spirochaetales bacterium]